MTASAITNILIGVAVLASVLYRQLQPRPVRDNMRLPLILGVIGQPWRQGKAHRARRPRGPAEYGRPQPVGPVLVSETEPVSPPGPHGLGHFYGGARCPV